MNTDCYEEIEQIILAQVAQKVLENLPEEQKRKVLEMSLTKTLEEVLRPWNVEKAIKDDVNRYMSEYIKRPEIQERIKVATQDAVDKLMEGVIKAIIEASQDHIKSKYVKFLKDEEK